MKLDELTEKVLDLGERVAALEAGSTASRQARGAGDLAIVRSIIAEIPVKDDGVAQDGTVLYAGAGPGPDGLTAFQMARRWSELVDADPDAIATALGALGHPHRVQIVQLLLRGQASTAEITGRLDEPSSGQLFHHLKELLAAGLIYQPTRGTYAVRAQHVVPLLTALSSAMDIYGSGMSTGGTAGP